MKIIAPLVETCNFSNFTSKSRLQYSKNFPFFIRKLVDNRISDYHFHDYTQIWYTVSGSYKHTQNGVTLLQNAGDIVFNFPFMSHSIDSSESDLSDTCVIEISLFSDLFADNALPFFPLSFDTALFENSKLPSHFKLTGENKLRADNAALDIFNMFDGADKNFSHYYPKLYDFFDACTKELNLSADICDISSEHKKVRYITDTAEYLRCNLSKRLSLQRASEFAAMSTRVFTDNFKRVVGKTCHNFLRTSRVSDAMHLAICTDMLINDIATVTGFANSGHLINTCIEYIGMSPTELRLASHSWDDEYVPLLTENRDYISSLVRKFAE